MALSAEVLGILNNARLRKALPLVAEPLQLDPDAVYLYSVTVGQSVHA